jgi:hypothetical protein
MVGEDLRCHSGRAVDQVHDRSVPTPGGLRPTRVADPERRVPIGLGPSLERRRIRDTDHVATHPLRILENQGELRCQPQIRPDPYLAGQTGIRVQPAGVPAIIRRFEADRVAGLGIRRGKGTDPGKAGRVGNRSHGLLFPGAPEGRQDLGDRSMVRAVAVEMLVEQARPRRHDERGAELRGPGTRTVDPVTATPGAAGRCPGTRMKKSWKRGNTNRSRLRRRAVVIDQDGEWDGLGRNKIPGIADITRSDRYHLGPRLPNRLVMLAQLRGVLAAVQSTEVTQKDQDRRPFLPEASEATLDPVCVGANQKMK